MCATCSMVEMCGKERKRGANWRKRDRKSDSKRDRIETEKKRYREREREKFDEEKNGSGAVERWEIVMENTYSNDDETLKWIKKKAHTHTLFYPCALIFNESGLKSNER